MWRRRYLLLIAMLVSVAMAAGTPVAGAPAGPGQRGESWLLAWAAPHITQDDAKPFTQSAFHAQAVRDQTIRQMLEPGAAGSALRVRLSNRYGANPVRLGAATLSVAAARGPAIVSGTTRLLSFGGARELTLWPGEEVVSDAVEQEVSAGARLALDLHVVSAWGPFSGHSMAEAVSWTSPPGSGDLTGEPTGAGLSIPGNAYAWVHSVDVRALPRPVVVVLSDSTSTGHVAETDYVWPVKLAERLGHRAVVVNASMVANNLTPSAVCSECNPSVSERIDHDALDLPGVTDVFVLAGTNDITQLVPVERMTETLAALARRAQARGVRFTVATVVPRQDWYQYYDAEVMGPMRHELNWWIRTADELDAAIDFDAAIRDPLDHERMWPPYDSGDRMHPGPLGMRKLAEVIDLSIFTASPARADQPPG